MKEIWKDIRGYEGYYQVSNCGNVKALERDVYISCRNGYIRHLKERILPFSKYSNGYVKVCLCRDNIPKQYMVHRLVAETFLENPLNYPEVNHKDENIENNNLDNLEWCTSKYNANYGTRNIRARQSIAKTLLNTKRYCPVCNSEFYRNNAKQKYCSEKCNNRMKLIRYHNNQKVLKMGMQ